MGVQLSSLLMRSMDTGGGRKSQNIGNSWNSLWDNRGFLWNKGNFQGKESDFLWKNVFFGGKMGEQMGVELSSLHGHRWEEENPGIPWMLGILGVGICGILDQTPLCPLPDKRALFIICTSELGPQIYELVALTSSEKNT